METGRRRGNVLGFQYREGNVWGEYAQEEMSYIHSNTVPLSSKDPEILEVEHAPGNCSAKLEKISFYVISGSKCISTDVSAICDAELLTHFKCINDTSEQMYRDT